MISIKFSTPDFKIKGAKGEEQIWDAVRKRWVHLTPEEWVRQNFIQYLIKEKNYPAALISVEKEITLGELKKRYDMVVYRDAQPWLIVECKEQHVALTENVLHQTLRYNTAIVAPYIIITNGRETYGWHVMPLNIEVLEDLPEWK